jgi:hypothetical protein
MDEYALLVCISSCFIFREITQCNKITANVLTSHILKELEIMMQLLDVISLFILRARIIANYNEFI